MAGLGAQQDEDLFQGALGFPIRASPDAAMSGACWR